MVKKEKLFVHVVCEVDYKEYIEQLTEIKSKEILELVYKIAKLLPISDNENDSNWNTISYHKKDRPDLVYSSLTTKEFKKSDSFIPSNGEGIRNIKSIRIIEVSDDNLIYKTKVNNIKSIKALELPGVVAAHCYKLMKSKSTSEKLIDKLKKTFGLDISSTAYLEREYVSKDDQGPKWLWYLQDDEQTDLSIPGIVSCFSMISCLKNKIECIKTNYNCYEINVIP